MPESTSTRPDQGPAVKRPGERRSQSRSATRALDVLELFAERRHALRAVEVGHAMALNPSSTNQLLKTMVGSGHLVFDARHKTYLPSARLTKFGDWILELYGSVGHLRDLVSSIQDRTGMVATVSSPNDLFMQIIDSAIPEGEAAERGLRISLFGSAIGGAYLSMLEDKEILRLAKRARLKPALVPPILDDVRTIRANGFADMLSADDRLWSIAVPLPSHVLSVPTVLGLAGAAHEVRGRITQLVEAMRLAIENQFGESKVTGDESDRPVHDIASTGQIETAGDSDMLHLRHET